MRELATLEGRQRARVASSLLGIRIVLTTIGVVLVSAFAWIAYGPLLGAGVLIAGAGVLVGSIQTTLSVPLMAGLRLGWVSALELGRQIAVTAFVVLFVVIGACLLPFLATPLIGALIVLVPTTLLVRGDIPLRPSFELAHWREMLKPIINYSLAVAAATLYFRLALVASTTRSRSRRRRCTSGLRSSPSRCSQATATSATSGSPSGSSRCCS